MKISTGLLLSLLLVLAYADFVPCNFSYFPIPQVCNITEPGESKQLLDQCAMVYRVNVPENGNSHIKELIKHNQNKTFGCEDAFVVYQDSKSNPPDMNDPYTIEINLQDPTLKSAFTIE